MPATQVKSKVKENKEPAKHPPPSRVPVGQIAEVVLKLVKEDGFNRDDAVKVLTIAKETEGSNQENRKEMLGELRAIYSRNYKALKRAAART